MLKYSIDEILTDDSSSFLTNILRLQELLEDFGLTLWANESLCCLSQLIDTLSKEVDTLVCFIDEFTGDVVKSSQEKFLKLQSIIFLVLVKLSHSDKSRNHRSYYDFLIFSNEVRLIMQDDNQSSNDLIYISLWNIRSLLTFDNATSDICLKIENFEIL